MTFVTVGLHFVKTLYTFTCNFALLQRSSGRFGEAPAGIQTTDRPPLSLVAIRTTLSQPHSSVYNQIFGPVEVRSR